jgi:hypothetical protein
MYEYTRKYVLNMKYDSMFMEPSKTCGSSIPGLYQEALGFEMSPAIQFHWFLRLLREMPSHHSKTLYLLIY